MHFDGWDVLQVVTSVPAGTVVPGLLKAPQLSRSGQQIKRGDFITEPQFYKLAIM